MTKMGNKEGGEVGDRKERGRTWVGVDTDIDRVKIEVLVVV